MYENIKHGDKKMGFLLFAYRKLSLTRQIDQLDYRGIVLSQKKQSILQQIGLTQEAMSNAKNMLSVFSNGAMCALQQNFTSQYLDQNGQLKAEYKDQELAIQNKFKQEQYAAMMTNSTVNSIFDAADKAQLSQLQALDTQIDQEIANNESQEKTLRSELESVKKGEDESAKNETPHFGLQG